MLKFECLQCGSCCKHVDQDFSEHRYIPIFYDEISSLFQLAENLNVQIEIQPDLMYPDKLNQILLITSYVLQFKENCGFYRENEGCLIYKNRPLTCQSFPIAIWREDANRTMLKVETSCIFVKNNIDLTLNKDFKQLKSFFPNEYEIAEKILMKGKEILFKIVRLEKEEKINLGYLDGTINLFYDLNQAIKDHPNWERIDINLIEID